VSVPGVLRILPVLLALMCIRLFWIQAVKNFLSVLPLIRYSSCSAVMGLTDAALVAGYECGQFALITGPTNRHTNMQGQKKLRQQHLPEKTIHLPQVLPMVDKSCGEKTRFPSWGDREFGLLD